MQLSTKLLSTGLFLSILVTLGAEAQTLAPKVQVQQVPAPLLPPPPPAIYFIARPGPPTVPYEWATFGPTTFSSSRDPVTGVLQIDSIQSQPTPAPAPSLVFDPVFFSSTPEPSGMLFVSLKPLQVPPVPQAPLVADPPLTISDPDTNGIRHLGLPTQTISISGVQGLPPSPPPALSTTIMIFAWGPLAKRPVCGPGSIGKVYSVTLPDSPAEFHCEPDGKWYQVQLTLAPVQ